MPARHSVIRVLTCALAAAYAGSGPAADTFIEPGGKLVLDRDLVLTDTDRLEIRGTPGNPALLDGQYHRVRSQSRWTGSVRIVHCRIQHLGSRESYSPDRKRLLPDCEAVLLDVSGSGEVVFEDCLFDESNSLEVTTREQSIARFRNNTVLDNMTYPIDKAAELSRGFLITKGNSAEPKVFQGNRVYRGARRSTRRTG